jgi:hypothetical protein
MWMPKLHNDIRSTNFGQHAPSQLSSTGTVPSIAAEADLIRYESIQTQVYHGSDVEALASREGWASKQR